MREAEFEKYLFADKNIVSKNKAIRSRISKARMIERHFEKTLDSIVYNDDIMYEILLRIKSEMKDTNGNISNSLRKYYLLIIKVFPNLVNIKKQVRLFR